MLVTSEGGRHQPQDPSLRPPSPLTSHTDAPRSQSLQARLTLHLSDPSTAVFQPLQPVTLHSISAIPFPAPERVGCTRLLRSIIFEVCLSGPRSHRHGRALSIWPLCLCSLETQPQQRPFPPISRIRFPITRHLFWALSLIGLSV
jgi:hypothetical protein